MPKTLIIDDDREFCLRLEEYLTRKGSMVLMAHTGRKARDFIDGPDEFDVVLCSDRIGKTEGRDILQRIRLRDSGIPVIILSLQQNTRKTVELMKLGACDHLLKPLFPEVVLQAIEAALSGYGTGATAGEPFNRAFLPGEKPRAFQYNFGRDYIFGKSPAFLKMLDQIRLVSPTDYSVIIYGESGSGKEAIAQEIHKQSKRASAPFVAIDCGALSRELSGSELFGHEKGAFTGAIGQKKGSFELANGGTIFLDEIANLSYDIQASLLRVVQERKLRRVGGTRDIPMDVRILISSNEILWDAVRKGKFREDLYHRFNEFSIMVPPLRDIKEDIMLFANHFLVKANQSLGKDIKGFSPEVEEVFRCNIWYGNLRELNNMVKRAALLAQGDLIGVEVLPPEIQDSGKSIPVVASTQGSTDVEGQTLPGMPGNAGGGKSLKQASLQKEYELIRRTLEEVGHNKSMAARILNIDRKTLYNKINAFRAMAGRGMGEP